MTVTDLPPRANLRPKEIVSFLSISLAQVYTMIEETELPSIKIGRHIRIPKASFLDWYNDNMRGSLAE